MRGHVDIADEEIGREASIELSIADQTLDAMLASTAKSLARYIMAIGASGDLDREVVKTHIDAMHTLGTLTSAQHEGRQWLVDGLQRIVDKKVGRKLAA